MEMSFKKWILLGFALFTLLGIALYKNTFNFGQKCSTITALSSETPHLDSVQGGTAGDRAVEQLKYDETWITVFVHGIMGIRPHLSISNIIRFAKDDVYDTEYSKAVEIMRKDPIFYQHQAMQGLGFQKMERDKVEPGYASGAMAYLFESITDHAHPESSLNNLYYTFGWSGITTESARHQAGRELYHLLAKEVIEHKKRGVTPKVRVIGYSHGGNVALNLGAVHTYAQHPFVVDELILLGTPVQVETDHLIQSPVFKKAYHLFSQSDRVQMMDCFSSKRLFSKKTFQSRASFEPPEKLRQIEIRITDTIRTKRPTTKGQELLVAHNKAFISGKSRFLRDRSPGHAELWFFGWTPEGYRKTYPLYPLPTIVLTPFIVRHVEDYIEQEQITKKNIVVDFRPTYGQMIVRKQHDCDSCTIADFLTTAHIDELKEYLKGYTPSNYTQELYDRQVQYACQLAKQLHREQYEDKELKVHTVKS